MLENIREVVITEGLNNRPLSEVILAKKLGIGRTSIRESLKHLESEGLIRRRQRTGISLRTPSLKEMLDIYDIRILLEGLAVRYLAENPNSAVLNSLKKASENFNRIKNNKYDKNKLNLIMADAEFHQIIIDNCPNKYLAKIINTLHLIALSFKVVNTPINFSYKKVDYPHERILAALRTGDSKKAEKILCLHIEEGRKNAIKFLLGSSIKLFQPKN